MSLQKEIESLLMWQDNIQGQDATYQQKASIAINKILDAVSMECIPGNIDDVPACGHYKIWVKNEG